MKKMIPVVAAIILIIIIIGVSVGTGLLEKYSYSNETVDPEEYFDISASDEVPIILEDELIEASGKMIDGVCYLPYDIVGTYLNDRFYYDEAEGLLLYSLPTATVRSEVGSADYYEGELAGNDGYTISRTEEENLYIAIDYVKKFTNFSYELFDNPMHMQLYTQDSDVQLADIKKNTAVRYQGGVKSPILREVIKGEAVTVLETMETWSKVKTSDSYIGYVENKLLENERQDSRNIAQDVSEPEYTNMTKDYKINLVWHQVTNMTANGNVNDMLASTSGVTTISPTWYRLIDNEGNIESLADQSYVDYVHSLGMEVWALIDNFTYKEAVDTYTVLSRTSTRAKIIESLMAEILQYNIDGINVDFEDVSEEAGPGYVQFIRELSIACRLNQIVLSVDNYVPKEHTTHYNRKEQGVFADYVIIMGYDEHYGGSQTVGSVASIDFVEEGIQKTVEEVPASKVINAIPFFTRVWSTNSEGVKSEAVGMDIADNFLAKNNVSAVWDEETCQNYGEVTKEGTLYQVWLEDEQSIETKLNIMKQHDLAGVAAWKLGYERQSIWDVIAGYVN